MCYCFLFVVNHLSLFEGRSHSIRVCIDQLMLAGVEVGGNVEKRDQNSDGIY